MDNGISERGAQQVDALVEYWIPKIQTQHALCLSSPKLRCIETIGPLAAALSTGVEVDPRLDEQRSSPPEGNVAYGARLGGFIQWWQQQAPTLTIACSHGDWIPDVVDLLVGEQIAIGKGCWVEVNRQANERYLISNTGPK